MIVFFERGPQKHEDLRVEMGAVPREGESVHIDGENWDVRSVSWWVPGTDQSEDQPFGPQAYVRLTPWED